MGVDFSVRVFFGFLIEGCPGFLLVWFVMGVVFVFLPKKGSEND